MQNSQKIQTIISEIKEKNAYIIGISGIPGAGKSHFSKIIQSKLQNSIIIPMDGFHLYRKDLTEDGHTFRGAAFTFDLKRFKQKILQLKKCHTFPINFPSFDHSLKDPIQDNIMVTKQHRHIIIQGLYIFDKKMDMESIWDIKIWVKTDIQLSIDRVARRHFDCKIEPTIDQCVKRANNNDRKNAEYVLNNSNFDNCRIIQNSFS